MKEKPKSLFRLIQPQNRKEKSLTLVRFFSSTRERGKAMPWFDPTSNRQLVASSQGKPADKFFDEIIAEAWGLLPESRQQPLRRYSPHLYNNNQFIPISRPVYFAECVYKMRFMGVGPAALIEEAGNVAKRMTELNHTRLSDLNLAPEKESKAPGMDASSKTRKIIIEGDS